MVKDQQPKTDKPIYFIRHNFNESLPVIATLENGLLIAIHFDKTFHQTIDQYTAPSAGFRTAFNDLKTLGEKGGLILIQYHSDAFYIAEVAAHTAIEPVNMKETVGGEDNFLKTLRLKERSKKYFYSQYPLLSALRPPFVTIRPLSEYARNMVEHLHRGTSLEMKVTNLHPKMLEQVCDEWLRSSFAGEKYRIRFELLQTGKTLPVIDIYAETLSGQLLNVQVTHNTDKKKIIQKAKALQDYMIEKKEELALFIGPKEFEADVLQFMPLGFVSTDSIFDNFKNDPYYKGMLEKMIGINKAYQE